MAEIGSVIHGKYEILREIGHGGMSVVYLAMDTRLNKPWAVKEIRKQGNGEHDEIIVNSLLAEANLMKRLDHTALPRIVDIIDTGVTIFIIMDYIEGESLDKVIKAEGAQPEQKVIGWARQLCEALSYLHSQKPPIIYRDMKPANVMLKPEAEGKVKIIDFGIAREYKEQKLKDTAMLGTEGYAPPEQYRGQTDARSDIFALGMTMHHLLTGIDPRSSGYRPVREINPHLSEGIEIIIDTCVQPAPENRYQNCAELLFDLKYPDLITKDYRKKQKRKLLAFAISAGLSFVGLISGVACYFLAAEVNNRNYEFLISPSAATSLEDKIESYKRAIMIYPKRTDAYTLMLEAYEDEGQFDKAKNDEFLAYYNANKDEFDKESKETADLNYKIGMMYFNYYSNEDGSYSFANRVQKAHSFFQENFENERISPDFANKKLSDCYYQICSFYKTYILNSATVEEASKDNYDALLKTIGTAVDNVKNAGAYDQLALYNGTFMLLYDQRGSMVQVNVEQKEVLDLMEQVFLRAKDLSVRKEQSKKLQQEITENYEGYKEAVIRAYANAKERA